MLFERMHANQRWENQPAAGWTLADLDVAEIRNTVAEAVRIGRLDQPADTEPEAALRGLGLIRGSVLLRAAAVLFGKTERLMAEMPQCLLRVARFRGLDRSEFLDNRQFIGNAFYLLASSEKFLRETVPIASRFERDRWQRIDEPHYPPPATREAMANAICRRDYAMGGGSIGLAVYDDRLEVTSIGPLHFGLTPADLFGPHDSHPWNPLIAGTFYRRGIIEEWGRGINQMAEFATSAGLPRPKIEERNNSVTVRFRRVNYSPGRWSTRKDIARLRVAILALLESEPDGLAMRDIRARLPMDAPARQVRRALLPLRNRGLVVTTGFGLAARWKVVPDSPE